MFSQIINNANKIYNEFGYPSIKEEAWRYTSTRNFKKCVQSASEAKFNSNDIDLSDDFHNIVFYNGELVFCDLESTEIVIESYSKLMNSPASSSQFLRVNNLDKNGVVAHNTSNFKNPLHLTIKRNKKIDLPIKLTSYTGGLDRDKIVFPRIYIHAEENSHSKIYINSIDGGAECSINSVIEFYLEESAKLDVLQLTTLKNQESIESLFFHQAKNSKINFFSSAIGGKLYRSNIDVSINGEGCSNNFRVLMLGSGSDHIDYHININHISKNSDSKFLCRSLLKDSSKGIFSGKIFVDKDASNTNAILNNNNLLLSKKSEVQSNPQLEINCESVKCAHGSTSGNLDKESLFYLRSRGINQKDAMKILIEGFINKLTTNINFNLSEINGKIKNWI